MNTEIKILLIGNPILSIVSYSFVVLLIFNILKVNYFNPIVSFFTKIYEQILRIPFLFSNQIINIFLIATFIKFISLIVIFGEQEQVLTLILVAIIQILIALIRLIFLSIIIGAILSWVSPPKLNIFLELVEEISNKSLSPIRKYIPSAGGLDFSPLFILIFIHLLAGFLVNILIGIV